MKVTVFIIDGLILKYRKNNMTELNARKLDEDLINLYINWNVMYLMSHQNTFSTSQIEEFQVYL